jgi:DNA-binding transcriptional LysR family regulator
MKNRKQSQKIPPLHALRAYEAVARRMSFSEAAEELYVTPSAISHQVKQLEEHLGVTLIDRSRRHMRLTEEGVSCFHALASAFEMIGDMTQRLQQRQNLHRLSVRVSLQTFAMQWLIPRLHKFREKYPELELDITTSLNPADLTVDSVDVFISRGNDFPEKFCVEKILDETLVAVRAASLSSNDKEFSEFTETRIVGEIRDNLWPQWAAAAGFEISANDKILRLEFYYLAVQAALSGLGTLVVPKCLVDQELKSGLLKKVSDVEVNSGESYYMIYKKEFAEKEKVRVFQQWLKDEIEASQL